MVIFMRVIAGTAKKKKLITPVGEHTRPTTDRIKETLFNVLQTEVHGSRFLDLFSGSGGIAIEALSRGAEYAVLIENDRAALRCIKKNLSETGFSDKAKVMPVSVISGIQKMEYKEKPFDIIFMDPPYDRGIESEIIKNLLGSSLIKNGTLIVAETSLKTDISYIESLDCIVEKVKEYKTNRHVFLRVAR